MTRIVTAVSELARNGYLYAGTGTIWWQIRSDGNQRIFEIVFDDDGPGIDDVEQALAQGYSTSEGVGLGLSGTEKQMDVFVRLTDRIDELKSELHGQDSIPAETDIRSLLNVLGMRADGR